MIIKTLTKKTVIILILFLLFTSSSQAVNFFHEKKLEEIVEKEEKKKKEEPAVIPKEKEQEKAIKKTSPIPLKKEAKIVQGRKWYFKLSSNINYYTLGSEIDQAIGQVESAFNGSPLQISLLNYTTRFSMMTDTPVKREKTNFLPTSNMGFGYINGRHQWEFDFGIAGFVPLKTVDVSTDALIRELPSGGTGTPPLALLGLVDPATGTGRYHLNISINEEVLVFTPSLYYDYIFLVRSWGRFSAGGNLGLIFLSARQTVKYRFERLDVGPSPYDKRVIEGLAQSTVTGNFGPVCRLYLGYKRPLTSGTSLEIRFGGSYGFIDMKRDVDGYGTLYMGGNALPVSFPASSLIIDGKNIQDRETNRLQLTGLFLQVGVVF